MRLRPPSAGIGLLSLVASLGIIATPAAADDPPDVVAATDFEDGTWDPWIQHGDPSVSVIDFGDGKVLEVANRTNDYDGIETPAGFLTPGQSYTITMNVRLAPGTEGAAGVRWVMKPTYTWGGATSMTADDWTTVTATYIAPDDGQVYIGTDDLSGPYTYLVDDILITTPTDGGDGPPTDVATLWSLDFDDDSHAPWTDNGGTLSYVDAHDGRALSIARTQDYHGIKSPVGELEHGVVYTFSMRARLPEGTEGPRDVRFVVEPAYDWVANTTIDGNGWTEVSGTYTLPADVDAANSAIYIGSSGAANDVWTLLIDDLLVTAPADSGPGTEVDLTFDFEDGTLQDWVARDAGGDPTVAVTTSASHGGDHAALVSDRGGQGDGIGHDMSGVFEAGVTYEITAWVKMAAGGASDDIWLSIQTGSGTFSTITQVPGVTSGDWHEVTASYTYPGGDVAFMYVETRWPDGGTGDFLIDDVTVRSQAPSEIEDLPAIWERHEGHFPVGVAIDERETFGGAAELTTRHFNQITAENHMKPDYWYSDPWEFQVHPQASALMDFAQANDLDVYGHVLVWHSQTPPWFFQDEAGDPLTTSAADQQLVRDRMRTHIFDVAQALSDEYGLFGSDTNPLNAWDVVNEVVSDSAEHADGLRRSEWYRILGEEFIDLAFIYAEEAFNEVYADPSVDRPVTLFINDYNTEQGGKQNRYYDLITRLLDRGVPVDGVGHQFHVSLSMPVAALEAAIVRFQDLDVVQAVTELDVTVGTPVTDANILEQGYYYRDAFRVFREYADDLYAVTVWGLTDNRSWRSAQAPLVFDANLQAKPAYYGIMDADLEPRLRTALVFRGELAIGDDALEAVEWDQLPLHEIDTTAAFQLRWEADHLTTYVEVEDSSLDATDSIEFAYQGTTVTVARDGASDADAVAVETDDGYAVVVRLPLDPPISEGGTLAFDVRVTDGDRTVGWSDEGDMGTLTLVEALSYLEVVETPTSPTIDAEVDEVWDLANTVTTDKLVSGAADGATADVRTLWRDDTLYVLMEVSDPHLDANGSDPWTQDSVEIFVDAGNVKNGPYRYDDTQIRINYLNQASFGTGDEGFQAARLESATQIVDGGYVVEAAISLLEHGGPGSFHGLDFQVNDATDGVRTAIHNWADPTGLGYQSTQRWGVGQLVAGPDDVDPDPAPRPGPPAHAGPPPHAGAPPHAGPPPHTGPPSHAGPPAPRTSRDPVSPRRGR